MTLLVTALVSSSEQARQRMHASLPGRIAQVERWEAS
jgi:hypothetical protein